MRDPVDHSGYAAGAFKYAHASGRKEFPVIQRNDERGELTGQWKAWMDYWLALGAKSTLALVANRSSWTVPTEWPWEFDGGYAGAGR